MMSPALNPKFYQIKIKIFQGQDLPMMDMSMGFLGKAKIDAYMKLDFKGKKYRTTTIIQEEGGPPVEWNKEFWLPAQLPVAAPCIDIRLMDKDVSSDEMVGTLSFKTKDILEGKFSTDYHWKTIYGSPMNQKNSKFKRLMNEHPEYASQWKGRVLVKITKELTEKPLAKIVDISEDDL
jgi:hypothetical protein